MFSVGHKKVDWSVTVATPFLFGAGDMGVCALIGFLDRFGVGQCCQRTLLILKKHNLKIEKTLAKIEIDRVFLKMKI